MYGKCKFCFKDSHISTMDVLFDSNHETNDSSWEITINYWCLDSLANSLGKISYRFLKTLVK